MGQKFTITRRPGVVKKPAPPLATPLYTRRPSNRTRATRFRRRSQQVGRSCQSGRS